MFLFRLITVKLILITIGETLSGPLSNGNHAVQLRADGSPPWSYENTEEWGNNYEQCNGRRQSPIALRTERSLWVPYLNLKFGNYDVPLTNVTLMNIGYTVQFQVPPTENGQLPFITGAKLNDRYEANNVHFHWGSPTSAGAEHLVDGYRYSVEMHIVHKNVRYGTVEEATMNPDGLAVLGIFLEGVNNPTVSYPGLDEIFNHLPEVREYQSTSQLNNTITMRQLLGNLNTKVFFSYSGSLTTPPCSEAVRWFVFRDALPVSQNQINKFFQIMDQNGQPLLNNYRPVQPLIKNSNNYFNDLIELYAEVNIKFPRDEERRHQYEPMSAHFHWGSPTSKGSEHTIDGHRFDVEMHIVYKNRKYTTMRIASKVHDGLLVVGVLFKKVKDPNIRFELLDKIFNSLPRVKTYKKSVLVKYPLKIADLLGNVDTNVFFSYHGSLTTPPCYQSVLWYVFRDAVPITEKQLNNFFQIMDVHGEPLHNNFRLPQSEGNRTCTAAGVANIIITFPLI
uniref:Carbonic anhydrase n=1 Tax=Glossina pallidipes TaxID=7398 RepID=A0A1A9ZJJ0_GLOPL